MISFKAILAIGLIAQLLYAQPTGRRRLVHPPNFFQPLPEASRLLWIAAHPDDELLIAPFLGEMCVDRAVRCNFLVLTRGEMGQCLLPSGCQPDLAAIRIREMEKAAALFGANLLIWDFADGTPGGADAARMAWSAAAGGEEALITRVAGHILTVAPDILLTFDPRHGSTCHTDHRAVGSLVLDARKRLGSRAPITYWLEDRVRILNGGSAISFSTAIPDKTLRYEANKDLTSISGPAWNYLILNAQIHASQFSQREVSALSAIPESQRVLHFMALNETAEALGDTVCDAD